MLILEKEDSADEESGVYSLLKEAFHVHEALLSSLFGDWLPSLSFVANLTEILNLNAVEITSVNAFPFNWF